MEQFILYHYFPFVCYYVRSSKTLRIKSTYVQSALVAWKTYKIRMLWFIFSHYFVLKHHWSSRRAIRRIVTIVPKTLWTEVNSSVIDHHHLTSRRQNLGQLSITLIIITICAWYVQIIKFFFGTNGCTHILYFSPWMIKRFGLGSRHRLYTRQSINTLNDPVKSVRLPDTTFQQSPRIGCTTIAIVAVVLL